MRTDYGRSTDTRNFRNHLGTYVDAITVIWYRPYNPLPDAGAAWFQLHWQPPAWPLS